MGRSLASAVLALLAAAAVAAGCGSTPAARFYVLEAVAAEPVAAPSGAPLVVDVGPVIVDSVLDRPQMVRREGNHEVVLLDYSRWAEPLADNIGRVLAENLAGLTGADVGLTPDAETGKDGWRVTLHVQQCEGGADGKSLLSVRWRLYRPGASEPMTTRKSSFSTELPSTDAAGVAAALSADLAALAREIAEALPQG